MRAKLLNEENGMRTFILVMDKGDEAFGQLTTFVRANRVTAASLTAIGACRGVKIGYFDPKINDYRSSIFDEQMEVLSLIGDIAMKGEEPALHAHIILGRKDSSVVGGHLQRVDVFPTMEVVLTEVPAYLGKRVDPHTGLALIAIDDRGRRGAF